jgi:flagellar operon protein
VDPRLTPAARAGALSPVAPASPAKPRPSSDGPRFADELGRHVGFRFSAHAEQRLAARGVSFDSSQLSRLEGGIDAAAAKGSREALVLVDSVAMVVAVGNRTVVTALAHDETGPAVFTNIDAAVIT